MIDKFDKIFTAEGNRYMCVCCGGKINKGEKYFRDAKASFRQSHTVNICCRCMVRFIILLGEEEVSKIKKDIIMEGLTG
jgi:hypothetical protein